MYTRMLPKMVCLVLVILGVAHGVVAEEIVDRAIHYDRARFFYERGIVFEAIKELELHIANQQDDIAAHLFLGALLAEVGHDERAATVMAQVLYLDPSNLEAERKLTRMRNNLGQRVDRSDPDAVLQFARIAARPGSYERAAMFYRLALALQDSTSVHLEFARMLSWAASYDESTHHYEIVLKRNPGALNVKREAGRVFNAQGNFTRAIEVLSTYMQRRPGDTTALLDLVWAHVWAGQAEEGERLLREVIRQDPERLDILLVRGSLAEQQNRMLDAYRYYQEALQRNPEHNEARLRLEALDQGKRIAIARLQEKVVQNPSDVESHLALAEKLEAEERFGEAIDLLERANRRNPENETIFQALRTLRTRDLQRVQDRLDQFRAARAARQREQLETLRAWLEANPEDIRTRMERIQLLFDAGLYADAEEEIREAQRLVSVQPVAIEMMNLIRARRQEQELQEGLREGRLLQ